MRSAPIIALALALALGAGCGTRDPAPAAAPPPFAIVGESTRLRLGEPLPAASAIFDGTTVRLRIARGDTAAVQVLRPGTEPVALELTGPGVAVTGFAVDYLEVREPSSRMYGADVTRGPGRYPDPLTETAQPVTSAEAALFDVAVAPEAAPGPRRGTLRIGLRAVPVELRIERTRIAMGTAPLVWVWYKRAELGAHHGLTPDDRDPRWRELEGRYDALFRAHGAYLASDLLPADAAASPRRTADLSYFPIFLRIGPELEADVAAAVASFSAAPPRPFVIPIDEPRTLARRLEVRAIGERIHRADPGRRILVAVTDRPRWIYGDAIDVFLSPHGVPRPAGFRPVQTWTYNGKPPEAGSMTLDTSGVALRTWGWIAARYRLPLWHAWEGLYYTDRYNGADRATDLMHEPITFDERRRGGEDHGNGDGVLVYPGPRPSLRLKALRRGLADRLLIEALRRCGERGATAAEAIATRTVPRALGEAAGAPAWPADERGFERARGEVLDALEVHCAVE